MREREKSLSGWGEASVFDGGCRLPNHHDLAGGAVGSTAVAGRLLVVAKFATTAADGKVYQVEYYSLDVIISVG